MQFYRVCGLAVASEIALPGLIDDAGRDLTQVTIRRGAVPNELAGASAFGPTWQIAGNQFLLRIPDIARFLLKGGSEIVFAPESEQRLADIPIFLLGTVFGILLHQRRQIVLHASAICVEGKAVLFCGPSGAGKSTLAAALSQHGYPLVSDDFCTVSVDACGLPTVHPDGRQLKLWAQAVDRLDLGQSRGEPVRKSLEKFYVEPNRAWTESLPLGALYALREARAPHTPGIEKPSALDCALLLRRHAYRPLLVQRLGHKANYFHAAVAIANSAGVFYLTRTLDFSEISRTIAQLERHWRDERLAGKAA